MVEPSWCIESGAHDVHLSKAIIVGERAAGGLLHARLRQRPNRPVQLTVTASFMTGVSADVSVPEGISFAEQLLKLLTQAT